MRPHANYLDNMPLFQHLIDESVLVDGNMLRPGRQQAFHNLGVFVKDLLRECTEVVLPSVSGRKLEVYYRLSVLVWHKQASISRRKLGGAFLPGCLKPTYN